MEHRMGHRVDSRRRLARGLFWLLPAAAFFLNPGFACTSGPDFQYGAEEMRAAVEGDWSFTITPTGGTPEQVTVHLVQATQAPQAASNPEEPRSTGRLRLLRAAHACGTRTLVASAAACADISQMPLEVSFVSGDATFDGADMSGMFSVFSLTFHSGSLDLRIGPYSINTIVYSDGSLGNANLLATGPSGTVVVTRQ